MVAVIDEQQQWFDEATNTPINNGFIYIGARNGDPRTAINIYSDRELTTPLANPQRTDETGRSVNKIWIGDRYSIEVSNSADVQKYIELDNGETASAATITLGNVLGSDTITADGNPTITSYDDLSEYVFRTVQVNTTDAVTINIDGVGAVPIVKNHDKPIQPGNFEADQNTILTYNSTDGVMEWANQNIKTVSSYVGTSISDSATPTIPTDGDYFEFSGTTTVASLSVGKNRAFTLKCTGARTFTASASIVTADGLDLTTAEGDVLLFQSTAKDVVQIKNKTVVSSVSGENVDNSDPSNPIVSGIGENQTWTIETGSRSLGVNYTNTSGRTIMVVASLNLTANLSSGTPAVVTVGGNAIMNISGNGSSSNQQKNISFLVPNTLVYSIATGTGLSITNWSELK